MDSDPVHKSTGIRSMRMQSEHTQLSIHQEISGLKWRKIKKEEIYKAKDKHYFMLQPPIQILLTCNLQDRKKQNSVVWKFTELEQILIYNILNAQITGISTDTFSFRLVLRHGLPMELKLTWNSLVVQVGLEFRIFLSQSPKHWDCIQVSHPTLTGHFQVEECAVKQLL